MIEFKNKNNTKGIKITENSIRSWKRNRQDGSRKYSNVLKLQSGLYQRIEKSINGDINAESIMLRDTKNNMKFIMDFNSNKVSVIQYNAPLVSGLKRIIIKM